MDLVYKAMMFARAAHAAQVRKYTGLPYWTHLAEVAGIVASSNVLSPIALAAAWLHDTVEDTQVTSADIFDHFGPEVHVGVTFLTDPPSTYGNRAERMAHQRERLARAPDWVQTIKFADNISNTSSILQYDPDFAKVYLREKREALAVMERGDRNLWHIAAGQVTP